MVHQFQHVKMLKWCGRAYDPGGVCQTAPGSLAIPYHTCPMPNINLPPGWDNVAPEQVRVFCPKFLVRICWIHEIDGFTSWLSLWMPISIYDPSYVASSTRITHLHLDGPTLVTMAHIWISLKIMWTKKRYMWVLFRKTTTYLLSTDQELCWIWSTPQYAHQNVKGTACYGDGSSKLCSPPDVLPTRNG